MCAGASIVMTRVWAAVAVAEVRRDRPGALRLRARWGVGHLELAAIGVPAIIFALVAAVAIAVAVIGIDHYRHTQHWRRHSNPASDAYGAAALVTSAIRAFLLLDIFISVGHLTFAQQGHVGSTGSELMITSDSG